MRCGELGLGDGCSRPGQRLKGLIEKGAQVAVELSDCVGSTSSVRLLQHVSSCFPPLDGNMSIDENYPRVCMDYMRAIADSPLSFIVVLCGAKIH